MTISFAQGNNQDSSSYREKEIIAVLPDDTIHKSYFDSVNCVPFQFVQKKEYIEKKTGNIEALPVMPARNDWTIGIIIFVLILFSIVYASTKTFFSTIISGGLFNKTMQDENKTIKLFRWEPMLLNTSSFFIISIFLSFAVSYSGVISGNFTGLKIWLYSTGIIVIAIILRHFICIITGLISNATEVFNDYIVIVYQTYRFVGFSLFIVMILFFYTPLINAKGCFIIGCAVVALFYLIRVLQLFLLFINHKISIFYLILYLCALEFLPVLIFIKYFSGLI